MTPVLKLPIIMEGLIVYGDYNLISLLKISSKSLKVGLVLRDLDLTRRGISTSQIHSEK